MVIPLDTHRKGMVINYGEKGGRGRKVLPLQKGGSKKVLAMLKGVGGAQEFSAKI